MNNETKRTLVAIRTELKDTVNKLDVLQQESDALRAVDLTLLNPTGLTVHYSKLLKLNDQIQTFVEVYAQLKAELLSVS